MVDTSNLKMAESESVQSPKNNYIILRATTAMLRLCWWISSEICWGWDGLAHSSQDQHSSEGCVGCSAEVGDTCLQWHKIQNVQNAKCKMRLNAKRLTDSLLILNLVAWQHVCMARLTTEQFVNTWQAAKALTLPCPHIGSTCQIQNWHPLQPLQPHKFSQSLSQYVTVSLRLCSLLDFIRICFSYWAAEFPKTSLGSQSCNDCSACPCKNGVVRHPGQSLATKPDQKQWWWLHTWTMNITWTWTIINANHSPTKFNNNFQYSFLSGAGAG